MDAMKDLKWLGMILLVIGIIWFVSGGPSRLISHQGPYLEPPTPNSPAFGYSANRVINAQDTNTEPSSSNSNSSQQTSGSSNSNQTSGGSQSNYSNLFSNTNTTTKIPTAPQYNFKFSGYDNTYTHIPAQEYVTISLDQNATTRKLLTGYRLESGITGVGATIGDGVYLPYLNQVNQKQPIYISPKDTVYIISGRSPVGFSFKLNKCTGYFEQFQDFSPSLPLDCPYPKDETFPPPPNNFNDVCIDFIDRLPRCQIYNKTFTPDITHECQVFVDNSSGYGNCVRLHQQDSDFYSSTWRVYLERSQTAWKSRHEIIQLLDRDGKVISQYSY